MKNLRQQFYDLLKPESCSGNFTMFEAAKMALIAKRMDELLDSAKSILELANDGFHVTSTTGFQIDNFLSVLKQNGYE